MKDLRRFFYAGLTGGIAITLVVLGLMMYARPEFLIMLTNQVWSCF